MGRTYLIAIVVMGLFAAILNTAAPSGSSSKDEFLAKARESAGDSSDSWSDKPKVSTQDGTVELDRSSDGHFYADVQINGASVRMLVDTGASGIALSREAARTAGVATSIGMNDVVGQGASGDVRGEWVKLDDVTLGHKSVKGLKAVVLNGGEMSLLGQEFLSKFESVEIRDDRMVLR